MKKMAPAICVIGSAVGFLILAVAVFLFYPASYLALNRGTSTLQLVAFLLFWGGLLVGVLLQGVCLVLRKRAAPDYRRRRRNKLKKLSAAKRMRRLLIDNIAAGFMAIVFLVGLAGSVISIVDNPISSCHTFVFMALAVLGLFEYLAFNSLNFAYAISKEW